MPQELPSDDMTDRDILLYLQSNLTAIYDRTLRGQFDVEADILEPLNDLLVYLEEATHPDRPTVKEARQ